MSRIHHSRIHHWECGAADPFDRGHDLGRSLAAPIRTTLADYRWLFDAAGLCDDVVRTVAEASQKELAGWAPDLAREVEGIAAGSGLEPWEAGALTARTEIVVRGRIAGLSECTTACWLPASGPARAVQTWDWIPRITEFTVRRHVSQSGLTVVAFAENGVLAKLGVNSARVGVLFTLLCHASDGSRDGVPVHAVVRRVLDTARTVDDAVEVVRSAPLAASAAMTVLHHDGDRTTGVVVEMSPDGVAVREPEHGFLLHTNHFLDPALAAGDRLVPIGDDTVPRMAWLREHRDVLRGRDRTGVVRNLVSHWADGAPICAHPRAEAEETNRWETKVTFALDLETPALALHPGGPCAVTEPGWQEVAA